MCGIVGIFGNINQASGKVFKDLLYFDVLRGPHSTGVAATPITGSTSIEKYLGTPTEFFEKETIVCNYNGGVKMNLKSLIGHNRYATVGGISEETAHPFNYGDIYGVHNGTLIDDSYLGGESQPSDSMRIYNQMAERGIDHVWKNLYGAAALVWRDDSNNTINMIRNSQRPLWYIELGSVFYYASEWAMIHAALIRNKIKIGDKKFQQLPENTLRSYKVEMTKYKLSEERKLENFTLPSYTKKKSNPTKNTGRGSGGDHNYGKVGWLGWAKDFDRCGKDTRGVELVTQGIGVLENDQGRFAYISAQFKDDFEGIAYNRSLRIFPTNPLQLKNLKENLGKRYKTIARVRARNNKFAHGYTEYRISGLHLQPVVENKKTAEVIKLPDMSDEKVMYTYPISQGKEVLLTKKEFSEALDRDHGGFCSICGEFFTEDDFDKIEWTHDCKPICGKCASTTLYRAMLNGVH